MTALQLERLAAWIREHGVKVRAYLSEGFVAVSWEELDTNTGRVFEKTRNVTNVTEARNLLGY